jgi:sortase A
MQDHQGGHSSSRGAGVLKWAERLFLIAGAAMLVWCAGLLAEAGLSQQAARRSLEMASHPVMSSPERTPAGTMQAGPPAPALQRGAAIADLSIPRISLSAVVLHGSDARTLRQGPGHLEHTALPGESGNVVIAGHRDSCDA